MTAFTGKNYRITFLTARLIRLEYQEEGIFEDLPTTFAVNRAFPDIPVTCRKTARGLILESGFLRVNYDEKPFCREGLSISVSSSDRKRLGNWHFGDTVRTLGGTARTLDEADGAIPVGPGLMSRSGFSVIDDSQSIILTEDGRFLPRKQKETDLYFFGYGHDYQACLKDFFALTGAVPMLPRFALGNWWSRYHEYSEESYLQLVDRFEQAGIPLSTAVIDMDWHITQNPYSSGWTGYTWNKKLFPDPKRFLNELHRRGLHTTLNLHPADGIAPHEDAYEAFCQAVGQDPAEQLNIRFDPTDETFMRSYFELLHHPLEEEGVDFWWIDWQQGQTCSMEGLDPLWVLNERHFRDIQRKKDRRGLILSRYAGPGSHRCPVGFSGDTVTTWESLAFQPYFTAMASNIGYPWWSHDIGGHMHGYRNEELTVRWLQFGVFSPILRLHSTKSEFMSKEPWSYSRETERIMTEWLRLRHRLIPYLYTAAERTHRVGEPLIRPVYYEWPEQEEAYQVPNQYLFGPSLMVCPITEPTDSTLGMARTKAWLPDGLWFDFFSGQVYSGGRTLNLWRDLQSFPVLARAGAIVPLSCSLDAGKNPEAMTLRIFAGASSSYSLYEDDGIRPESPAVRTEIGLDWEKRTLTIGSLGDLSLLPQERTWNIECIGFTAAKVLVDGRAVYTDYDSERNALCFTVKTKADGTSLTVNFPEAETAADDHIGRTKKRLLAVQTSFEEKEQIAALLRASKPAGAALYGTLQTVCRTPGLADCLAETLFSHE